MRQVTRKDSLVFLGCVLGVVVLVLLLPDSRPAAGVRRTLSLFEHEPRIRVLLASRRPPAAIVLGKQPVLLRAGDVTVQPGPGPHELRLGPDALQLGDRSLGLPLAIGRGLFSLLSRPPRYRNKMGLVSPEPQTIAVYDVGTLIAAHLSADAVGALAATAASD